MTLLTRRDEGLGVGAYDSILWAFTRHVKARDNPKYKSAILYGSEDSPSKIEFFTQANPNVNTKPAYTWHHHATRYDNPSSKGKKGEYLHYTVEAYNPLTSMKEEKFDVTILVPLGKEPTNSQIRQVFKTPKGTRLTIFSNDREFISIDTKDELGYEYPYGMMMLTGTDSLYYE